MWSAVLLLLLIAVVAGVARRDQILAALDRFDDDNRAKKSRAAAALRTPNAHMVLTIEEIDERTEPVETVWAREPETGAMRKRFLWRGAVFNDEAEAQDARQQAVLAEARAFYADLDQSYRLGRRP